MSSLEERLRRLRQSSRPSASTVDSPVTISGPDSNGAQQDCNEEEVNALLRATADEVATERTWHDDISIEGEDSASQGSGDEVEEDAATVDEPISEELLGSFAKETEALTREAERSLQDLHVETQMGSTSKSLIRLQPKDRPILSREVSDRSGNGEVERGGKDLESDLADAMADDLNAERQATREKKHTPENLSNIPSNGGMDEELAGRLGKLRAVRSNHLDTEAEEQNTANPFLDLPSAPNTQPIRSPPRENVDWKDRHGVQGRDLSSYEALVRLNATALGAPSASMNLPNIPKKSPARDERDDWCCICNEDAMLLCLGCDNDLYCKACWNEGHLQMDPDELREHRTKLFAGHSRKPILAG